VSGLPALLVAAAIASVAAGAHAQDSGPRRQGAQVRLLVGPAYVHMGQDVDAAQEIGAEGVGYAAQLAIGVMVSDALALNSELAFARTDAAEHDILGETSATALFVGLGATYWLLPADVYFSGSIGATRSSIEGAPLRVQIEVPQSDASEVGFGTQLTLGKTFALSAGFGLGAAFSFGWATAANPVSGVDSNRQVLTALLALAVTVG
jgi:opacity protein-like surface antigen